MLDNVIQDVASLTTRMYTMLVTHTNLFLSHPPTHLGKAVQGLLLIFYKSYIWLGLWKLLGTGIQRTEPPLL
jgi:hypothetical protein